MPSVGDMFLESSYPAKVYREMMTDTVYSCDDNRHMRIVRSKIVVTAQLF